MPKIGTELAPLLGSAVTGKPRRDPDTGYMMNHSLATTDVTRLAVRGHQVSSVNSVYNTQLRGQVVERAEGEMRDREREAEQQNQHFQVRYFRQREIPETAMIRAGTHSGGGRAMEPPGTAHRGRIS